MDGLAVWTEASNEGGLDPLAMGNPIENLYQSLLPGMSSVTTRLRLYAFHSWWIADFVDRQPDAPRSAFAERTRRVEYLFALANAPGGWREQGAGGGLMARKVFRSGVDPVDLATPTGGAATPPAKRYLLPEDGEFRAVWTNQMIDMGLLRRSGGVRFPTGLGRELARAFAASVGDAGSRFLDLAVRDQVTRAEILELAPFRFSALPFGSPEEALLRDLLLGAAQARIGSAERLLPEQERMLSQVVVDDAGRRGRSLAAIFGAAGGAEPASATMLRWHWLGRALDQDEDPTVVDWGHYQTADMVRVVYEVLLRHVVSSLEAEIDGIPLSEIGTRVCRDLPDATLGAFLDTLEARNHGVETATLQAEALRTPGDVAVMLAPLARLAAMWSGRVAELARTFPLRDQRQTAASELAWIEAGRDRPARDVVAELVRLRVARRHLAVACRKLAHQNAYTFLFDLENGRLRARTRRRVDASSPRLGTALRFLEDARLLEAGRPTAAARRWLMEDDQAAGPGEAGGAGQEAFPVAGSGAVSGAAGGTS